MAGKTLENHDLMQAVSALVLGHYPHAKSCRVVVDSIDTSGCPAVSAFVVALVSKGKVIESEPMPIEVESKDLDPGKPSKADDILSAEEVAEIYRISPETVRAMCRGGKLRCHRPTPRSIRIFRKDAMDYFVSR